MADLFRLSQHMIEPALMATRPVGVTPRPPPIAVGLSPPVARPKETIPVAYLAAGAAAIAVIAFVVYKKKFAKGR